MRFLLIPLFLASTLSLSAESRSWRNSKGTNSFKADYISNDGKKVTLRKGRRILTVDIGKLHNTDQTWLKTNHPADPKLRGADALELTEGTAFDTIEFGDTQHDVIQKFKKSQFVTGEAVEAFLGRTGGINGVYKTSEAVGGLHCRLYFEWTGNKSLKELSLRTDPLSENTYNESLKKNWKEWIQLLTSLHGKPVQDGDYPDQDELDDGLVLGSHLWHTEDGHSVILGTGQDGTRFSVVVRITSEHISPMRIQ